jgi:hypothetical protein
LSNGGVIATVPTTLFISPGELPRFREEHRTSPWGSKADKMQFLSATDLRC